LDLSNYALWLGGTDIWNRDEEDKPVKGKARRGEHATIECFLGDLLTHDSGGTQVAVRDVTDIFHRIPSLVVLDGLDEVGSPSTRKNVVREIDNFVSRGKAYDLPPQIVVTTRPSAGALPEPSPELFEVLALNQLTAEQRASYLRKWCAVRNITGKDGATLRASFHDKSREPYIAELASNPMQLTILLDLLHQQGAATPTQRTDLYDKYVELLLAREANKHPDTVRKYKDELTEIIPFLGWYLHAHTEDTQIRGRMSVGELKEAMRHYQRAYRNPETIVDALFEGTTDRLWTLTGKIDGTYEFEVLSLREYFAAQFLYRNAGEGDPDFDPVTVLRELLRRPYWLNTLRFYGGNARGRGVYTLTAGIEHTLSEPAVNSAAYLAVWALLTDGVFHRRPLEARKVLNAVCSDQGLQTLLPALERREIHALPELPGLADTDDPDPTWARLTEHIRADPSSSANRDRVRALSRLLNQRTRFTTWWSQQLDQALGGDQQDAWLRLAAECEAGAGLTAPTDRLDLRPDTAQPLLNAGMVPVPGSDLENALVEAILAGQCPAVSSTRSLPAQIAVALKPGDFFTDAGGRFQGQHGRSRGRRNEAIIQLRRVGSPYAQIATQRAFKAGQKGSTFPWANTAAALHKHAGRCWLACEIAIIGAASPLRLGYTKQPGAEAFGPKAHPVELLAQTRTNTANGQWWAQELSMLEDPLDLAGWALALWAVAAGTVISDLLPDLERVLADLSQPSRRVVLRAAHQITQSGWLTRRPIAANPSESELVELAQARSPNAAQEAAADPDRASLDQALPAEGTLLTVARAQRWLKVDSVPAYR
jgi:hypothetical protein